MQLVLSFGAWVGQRRHALRLTQQEVARLVGCSPILIRKIEADERRPSAATAERLARALQVPPDTIPAFVRAARAELAADRLPPPSDGAARALIAASYADSSAPRAYAPGNLPAQLSSFLGRERELSELRALLRQDGVRLVTLTGVGGTGKTRLAIEAVGGLGEAYPDGIWFVDLAPVQGPQQVAAVIAQTCGVPEQPGQPPEAQLARWMRPRRLLLVLDNYEHLLEAAPLASALLRAAPLAQILATSRVPLHLTGEHEFVVPPLALSDPQPDGAAPSRHADAVLLFVARARAVLPEFRLTAASAPLVRAICACLDGLPLAIELAAARTRLFTPEQLLARLQRALLPQLEGGARDLPARQQTMRATIAWSERLLDAPERRLLARLSVFVGGWTLEAAEAVCCEGEIDIAAALERLVEHSLVQVSAADGWRRFRMLETIRAFAAERLEVEGEVPALQRRHARYFVEHAERQAPQIYRSEQFLPSRLLLTDQENLRAALSWLLSAAPNEALQLACALWEYWDINGALVEAHQWLTRALEQSAPEAQPLRRAYALNSLGFCAHLLDENDRAIALFRESAALYAAHGDTLGATFSTMHLCLAYRKQSRVALATEALDRCEPVFAAHGSTYGIAWCRFLRGLLLMDEGERGGAWVLLQQARVAFQQCGNNYFPDWICYNLGHLARLRGDLDEAEELYTRALAMLHRARDMTAQHEARICLGHLARLRGDARQAAAIYAEELMPLAESGNRRRVADVLDGIGGALLQTGEAEATARLMGAALELREAIAIPLAPSEQPGYQQMLAALEAQLPEPARSAAWAAGRAMPLDAALAEALRLAARCAHSGATAGRPLAHSTTPGGG